MLLTEVTGLCHRRWVGAYSAVTLPAGEHWIPPHSHIGVVSFQSTMPDAFWKGAQLSIEFLN